MSVPGQPGPPAEGPPNPYLVLAAAILPGGGHVLLGQPRRGLQFIFFMVILAWITTKFAPDGASFIGRHAGGVLVYALSVLDAYKIARIRHATWQHRTSDGAPSPGSGT